MTPMALPWEADDSHIPSVVFSDRKFTDGVALRLVNCRKAEEFGTGGRTRRWQLIGREGGTQYEGGGSV